MKQTTTLTPGCVFEELGHTADVGMRILAESAPSLFECAALAMMALISSEADASQKPNSTGITVTSMDMGSLMVNWLSELLYLHEVGSCLVTECSVIRLSPKYLQANVMTHRQKRIPALHIKAVTYHQMRLEKQGSGWLAEVFFDI